jgi:hypothetical protein
MRFANDIDDATGGRFLPQGLLGSSAQWSLPLGVTQVPPVRWAARALLMFATVFLLTWAWAIFSQARSGQGAWFHVVIAVAVALPWLMMTWRSWQSLDAKRMVTLHWGGLPPFRPADAPAEIPPGWSLQDSQTAHLADAKTVTVHVVFDLGVWVLVKIVHVGEGGPGETWSWLDARICFKGSAGHHLRSLLFSTRANHVAQGQLVASCGSHQIQRSNLLSPFKTNGKLVEQKGAIRRKEGAQGRAVAGKEFAETVILVGTGQSKARRSHS